MGTNYPQTLIAELERDVETLSPRARFELMNFGNPKELFQKYPRSRALAHIVGSGVYEPSNEWYDKVLSGISYALVGGAAFNAAGAGGAGASSGGATVGGGAGTVGSLGGAGTAGASALGGTGVGVGVGVGVGAGAGAGVNAVNAADTVTATGATQQASTPAVMANSADTVTGFGAQSGSQAGGMGATGSGFNFWDSAKKNAVKQAANSYFSPQQGAQPMGDSNTNQSTSTSYKTPAQQRAIEAMFSIYGPLTGTWDPYTGQTYAPMNATQQGAINQAGAFTGKMSPYSLPDQKDIGIPLNAETGGALQGILSGQTGAQKMTPDQTSDYFNASYYNPAMKSLKEDVNPAIDESFAGPGFFGAARSQERVHAAQDTSDWLGEQRGNLDWNVLLNNQALDEAKAGRTLSAIPQGMAYGRVPMENAQGEQGLRQGEVSMQTQAAVINAARLSGLEQIFAFGQAEQTDAQKELNAMLATYLQKNQITDPETLKVIMALIGEQIGTNTTGVSSQDINNSAMNSNDWGRVGAGAGAGVALDWLTS